MFDCVSPEAVFDWDVGGQAAATDANAQQLEPPLANQFGRRQSAAFMLLSKSIISFHTNRPAFWFWDGRKLSFPRTMNFSSHHEFFIHKMYKRVRVCLKGRRSLAHRRSKKLWRVKRVYHKNYIKPERPSAFWCRREPPIVEWLKFLLCAEVPVEARHHCLCMWVTRI